MESVKRIIDIQELGRLCHEINRTYCRLIGDIVQPAWDTAPTWQKDSVVNGLQYFIEHPDVTPEGMHENWMHKKIADGWAYGEINDPEKKTHPCMMSYEKLPVEQRMKDHLFLAVCKSYFQVY